MTPSRISWVDIARGSGIILMVYGHTSRGLVNAGMTYNGFTEADLVIYSFHMPLFFALSGYFFRKSLIKGEKQFIWSKIATIAYPYLVWSLIQILIQFATSKLINGDVTFNDVLTFYLPRGQYWFLFALFIIDLLTLYVYKWLGEKGLMISTVVGLAVMLLNVDLGLLNLAINNVVFFNFGILLSNHSKKTNEVLDTKKWMAIVFAAFVLLEIIYLRNGLPAAILIALSLIGTTFVIQLSKKINGNHLAELGQNSMAIFLMHTIVSAAIRIVLQKFLHIEHVAVHLLLGFVGGIYIPYFFVKYSGRTFGFLFIYPGRLPS